MFIRVFATSLLGEIHMENDESTATLATKLKEHEAITGQFDGRKIDGNARAALWAAHLFANASQYLVE